MQNMSLILKEHRHVDQTQHALQNNRGLKKTGVRCSVSGMDGEHDRGVRRVVREERRVPGGGGD